VIDSYWGSGLPRESPGAAVDGNYIAKGVEVPRLTFFIPTANL
jgi:hypothetical protein